jgi:hypothetical protein
MLVLNRSREELATLFKGVGAEIGVERGIFSEKILLSAQELKKIYLIDPWTAYRGYTDHTRQEKLDRFYEETKSRLIPYHPDRYEIIRKFSMDALEDFSDESLDFVYIDANHSYEHAVRDITEWAKKVKVGGIIAGHDYIARPIRGESYQVIRAVNDYLASQRDYMLDRLTIYENNNSPSWMFLKTAKRWDD